MAWTSEDLVAAIKRFALIPTAQSTFTTSDFLAIANEELQTYVVPLVTSQREDYFIAHYDVILQDNVIEYRLPTRAVGQALRDVVLITPQNQIKVFPRIAREDLDGAGHGFYLDGNILVLVIDDPAKVSQLGTSLRMTYHLRPNTLVLTTAVGTVSGVNTGTKQVTVSGASFSSGSFDMVRGRSGFECLAIDRDATVAGSTLTFSVALPAELAVGDVIALPGESNYPQIPLELHPLLARRSALRCLEAMGDQENVGPCAQALSRMESDAVKLLTPRVASQAERIVNRGSHFRSLW